MHFLVLLFLGQIFPSSSLAAVLSFPRARRDDQVCGGNKSLFQCGASLPADFCCPASTTCHQLDSSVAIAVLCCPAGQDCNVIQPIQCDQSLQNATSAPGSQFHSDPITVLGSCGNGCCPVGASCHSGMCVVKTKQVTSSTSSSIPSTSATPPTTPAPSSTVSTNTPSTSTASVPVPAGLSSSEATKSSSDSFSGTSFVAGFLPGIILGILLITLLFWLLARRRNRRNSNSHHPYTSEKNNSHDDELTDLTPPRHQDSPYRPTLHARSISEPIADPSAAHRTDFSRHTPPRFPDPILQTQNPALGYTANISGPSPPPTPSRTPKIRALFSRSPAFPAYLSSPRTPPGEPLPSHLKRGTLSHSSLGGFTVSPIRALRTKKSSHSLRRQLTSATNATARSRSRAGMERSRSGSTETIQVLMPSREPYTPDQRVHQPAPATIDSSWRSTGPTQGSASRVPEETPTRAGPGQPAPQHQHRRQPSTGDRALGTPYTSPNNQQRYYGNRGNGGLGSTMTTGWGPGKVTGIVVGDHGLTVQRQREEADRRLTTFSGMMERAGMSREEMGMGRR